jgi:hypothetical protein
MQPKPTSSTTISYDVQVVSHGGFQLAICHNGLHKNNCIFATSMFLYIQIVSDKEAELTQTILGASRDAACTTARDEPRVARDKQ